MYSKEHRINSWSEISNGAREDYTWINNITHQGKLSTL